MNTCGRCGRQDRDVRLALANLAREARQDNRVFVKPEYDFTFRCRDRDACRERARHRPQLLEDPS